MKREKVKVPRWVAVKVERGFPTEAVGFSRRSSAEKLERRWRKNLNFDYDETEVLPLIIEDDLASFQQNGL